MIHLYHNFKQDMNSLIVTEIMFKFQPISGLQTKGCWSWWWGGSLKIWWRFSNSRWCNRWWWGFNRKCGKCSTGWKRKGNYLLNTRRAWIRLKTSISHYNIAKTFQKHLKSKIYFWAIKPITREKYIENLRTPILTTMIKKPGFKGLRTWKPVQEELEDCKGGGED